MTSLHHACQLQAVEQIFIAVICTDLHKELVAAGGFFLLCWQFSTCASVLCTYARSCVPFIFRACTNVPYKGMKNQFFQILQALSSATDVFLTTPLWGVFKFWSFFLKKYQIL
jgi:hypothetical protein